MDALDTLPDYIKRNVFVRVALGMSEGGTVWVDPVPARKPQHRTVEKSKTIIAAVERITLYVQGEKQLQQDEQNRRVALFKRMDW